MPAVDVAPVSLIAAGMVPLLMPSMSLALASRAVVPLLLAGSVRVRLRCFMVAFSWRLRALIVVSCCCRHAAPFVSRCAGVRLNVTVVVVCGSDGVVSFGFGSEGEIGLSSSTWLNSGVQKLIEFSEWFLGLRITFAANHLLISIILLSNPGSSYSLRFHHFGRLSAFASCSQQSSSLCRTPSFPHTPHLRAGTSLPGLPRPVLLLSGIVVPVLCHSVAVALPMPAFIII